jgi:hypothetical protein
MKKTRRRKKRRYVAVLYSLPFFPFSTNEHFGFLPLEQYDEDAPPADGSHPPSSRKARRAANGQQPQGDFFGFGKSLTVKGSFHLFLPPFSSSNSADVPDHQFDEQKASSPSPMSFFRTTARSSLR